MKPNFRTSALLAGAMVVSATAVYCWRDYECSRDGLLTYKQNLADRIAREEERCDKAYYTAGGETAMWVIAEGLGNFSNYVCNPLRESKSAEFAVFLNHARLAKLCQERSQTKDAKEHFEQP